MTAAGTLARILALLRERDVRVSAHGYGELAADGILVRDVLTAMPDAEVVEDYPAYHKGPSVLVLIHDDEQRPVHVVWGIAKDTKGPAVGPAVLVTAYRPDPVQWTPDPVQWTNDFRQRKP